MKPTLSLRMSQHLALTPQLQQADRLLELGRERQMLREAMVDAGQGAPAAPSVDWKKGWPLVFANALSGPTLGVGCYQLALKTTAAGLVLPIVATSPLVTLLLAWWIDRERPTRRSLLGGLLAVSGAVALKLLQA